MPRAKRGTKARARRKRVFQHTEGYFIGRNNKYKRAVENLHRAWKYAFRDRRKKKRDFRGLWITRISEAVKKEGISYSIFINKLKGAKIELDRKILNDLVQNDPETFKEIVSSVK